jgi:HSP20 family protein
MEDTMTLPVRRSHRLQPGTAEELEVDPLRELAALHQRMSRLMTTMLGSDLGNDPGGDFGFGAGLGTGRPGGAGIWTPLADVTETDDAYLVEIEVPGVNRKELTVEVVGSELRVTGEIVEKEKVGWLRRRTRRIGEFAYHTRLPAGIDTDEVTADLADGVLTVRVPKTEKDRPRRITVNAS